MNKKVAYSTVFLLTLIYILSFLDRQIVAVLAVPIRDALSLNNFQSGLLYGPAFSFIYALAGIPMGRIADNTSRKGMICLGLLIWSIMTVLSGFAASFIFLVTARIFVGLSQAMLSPAVYSYLADTFTPEKRATIFSFYASGIFIGIGLSFLIGGSIALNYDWRVSMISVGLPGVLLAPVAWWVIREPERKSTETPPHTTILAELRILLLKPALRWHLLGFSFLACTGYTILSFTGNVFSDVFNRPDLTPMFGWFMFGVGITVILSGKAADYFARKSPEKRFYSGLIAALGGVPFYYLGLFHTDADTAYLLIGAGVLISSSYNGVAAALIQFFVLPGQRALAGGLYLFVISIAGFGFGPPLAGWLTDFIFTGSYAVSYAIFSVLCVCGAGATVSFIFAMKNYAADAIQPQASS